MKVKDADILIVPGYTNSGPDHWQTRWQAKLSTARRVEQAEWSKPVREDWTANVAKAVNEAEQAGRHRRAFAGRPDGDQRDSRVSRSRWPARSSSRRRTSPTPTIRPKHLMTFGPYPRDPLPFPSITIGSRNDPFCAFDVAEDIAGGLGLAVHRCRRGRPHQCRFRLWPVAGRLDGLRAVPVAAVSRFEAIEPKPSRGAEHDFRAAARSADAREPHGEQPVAHVDQTRPAALGSVR